MSPALHPSDDPTTATPVLFSATRCYHALLGDKEMGTAAAVQAILNQLSAFERGLIGGASSVDVSDMASFRNGDLSQGESASNLVHAVSLLARETQSAAVSPPSLVTRSYCRSADSGHDLQAQRQVGSALQQSALSANQSIASAALCELSELAAVLGKDAAADTFREYLRTVVSAAAGCSSSEDVRFQTVRTLSTAHSTGACLTKRARALSLSLSLRRRQSPRSTALPKLLRTNQNGSERRS